MGSFYAVYTEYLEHYGVKGQKWGVRRDKLLNKKAKNSDRINKLNSKLDSKMTPRRKAKLAKMQYKYDKYQKRHLLLRTVITDAQVRKYQRRIARLSAPGDRLKMKISKLEYKNTKIQKRIDRIDKKIAMSELG